MCPFYGVVRLIKVSVKWESTVLLKIKTRDFFQRDSIPILVSCTLKTWKFLYFRNETCYRNGNLCKDFFLFVFNLVLIRIHKTSLFWLNNLMTSLWKPSIDTCISESGSRIGYHFRPFLWRKVVPSRMVTLSAVLLIFGVVMEPRSFSKSSKYGKIL